MADPTYFLAWPRQLFVWEANRILKLRARAIVKSHRQRPVDLSYLVCHSEQALQHHVPRTVVRDLAMPRPPPLLRAEHRRPIPQRDRDLRIV